METILEMKLHIQNIYIACNQNLFTWTKSLVKTNLLIKGNPMIEASLIIAITHNQMLCAKQSHYKKELNSNGIWLINPSTN